MAVCDRPTYPHRSPRPRRPLDEWRRKLAADYLPLARTMARPLKARFPGIADEFESAACMALVEAAEVFDPTRNVRFSTFVHHRIKGALRDVQRRQLPFGYRGHADESPFFVRLSPEIEEHGRVMFAEPDGPVGWGLEAIDAVEAWLRKLRPQHARACRLIFLYGLTHAEVGRLMGVSACRVAFIRGEAMKFLSRTRDARVRRERA